VVSNHFVTADQFSLFPAFPAQRRTYIC